MDLLLERQKCIDTEGAKQQGQNGAKPTLCLFFGRQKVPGKKEKNEEPEKESQRRIHRELSAK
jgi:hypothetical protein